MLSWTVGRQHIEMVSQVSVKARTGPPKFYKQLWSFLKSVPERAFKRTRTEREDGPHRRLQRVHPQSDLLAGNIKCSVKFDEIEYGINAHLNTGNRRFCTRMSLYHRRRTFLQNISDHDP